MSEPTSEILHPTVTEGRTPSKEVGNYFPEIIANSPLDNTSLVYSVPVMGEWKNGNLQRMLRGMFSQRPKQDEAFEVEVIANIGGRLASLMVFDKKKWEPKKDETGKIILDTNPQNWRDPQNWREKKTADILLETDEAVGYLRHVVEAQKLARTLKAHPQDDASQKKIDNLLGDISDPLQKHIIQLAMDKADSISLAVIDATHTLFGHTDYEHVSLDSLRTLGADIARTRFETKPDIVLGLYDADTIPEGNNAVKDLQQIFSQHPDLNYLFTGMTNLPAGHSKNFVGDAPRENIRRTSEYNSQPAHGSPQISFRLRAYDRLKELSGGKGLDFHGDEDMYTSYRLIYHFGSLQDGLLLESSGNLYAPTSMTADRLDGSVDSKRRGLNFSENGTRYLSEDLGSVFAFREQITKLIEKLPPEKQDVAVHTLEKARTHFEKKQKTQQRFNRLVLNTFFDAQDKGLIKNIDGQIQVNETDLVALIGGDALLHYVQANKKLIGKILSSPDDLKVMRYYLGKAPTLPDRPLSSFQLAIREYLGEVQPLDKLTSASTINIHKIQSVDFPRWQAEDLREKDSKISVMHSTVAEMLALAHTYKAFFETSQFIAARDDSDKSVPKLIKKWSKNLDEQEVDMNYGDPKKRFEKIKENVNVRGTEIGKMQKQDASEEWLSQIQFRSIPIFELFRRI